LHNSRIYKGLPLAQQFRTVHRLLEHVEKSWGAKPELTTPESNTYLYLPGVAGQILLDAKKGKDAVAFFERYLEVVQQLRRTEPLDPNHQMYEALGYLYLGDAHGLAGDAKAAMRAYNDARRVFESASADARGMLTYQDFSNELESRRTALSLVAKQPHTNKQGTAQSVPCLPTFNAAPAA
jgi:hypothetical protein